MKIRKHFRTTTSTIDYIISDFSLNRIGDKDRYLKYCVDNRIKLLHNQYDEKLDKILSFIILRCDYDNMPIESISRIVLSISKITNVLSKGFISLICKD